ncbi:hypothetical protein D6779_11070 [Candidatus Parcubacteria bacterium]|nr:MAG: hypothetical protein D6779_11070 [Candidatus Parcubacteria bacterium]
MTQLQSKIVYPGSDGKYITDAYTWVASSSKTSVSGPGNLKTNYLTIKWNSSASPLHWVKIDLGSSLTCDTMFAAGVDVDGLSYIKVYASDSSTTYDSNDEGTWASSGIYLGQAVTSGKYSRLYFQSTTRRYWAVFISTSTSSEAKIGRLVIDNSYNLERGASNDLADTFEWLGSRNYAGISSIYPVGIDSGVARRVTPQFRYFGPGSRGYVENAFKNAGFLVPVFLDFDAAASSTLDVIFAYFIGSPEISRYDVDRADIRIDLKEVVDNT